MNFEISVFFFKRVFAFLYAFISVHSQLHRKEFTNFDAFPFPKFQRFLLRYYTVSYS